MTLKELQVGVSVANTLIDTVEEEMEDLEIQDGAFVCAECREEYELEEDMIMFGLCGNCYTKGEVDA